MKLNTIVMKMLKPFKPITPLSVRRRIVFRLIEHEVGFKLNPQLRQGIQMLLTELGKCETLEQRKLLLAILLDRWQRNDQAERNTDADER
jgi:hypothetical protein